jgi:hypothetical protein
VLRARTQHGGRTMNNPNASLSTRTQKRAISFFVVALVVFGIFLIYGLWNEHFWETLSVGATICLSCIGVG